MLCFCLQHLIIKRLKHPSMYLPLLYYRYVTLVYGFRAGIMSTHHFQFSLPYSTLPSVGARASVRASVCVWMRVFLGAKAMMQRP